MMWSVKSVRRGLNYWLPSHQCVACGTELKPPAVNLCAACTQKLPFNHQLSVSHWAPFSYESPVREMIMSLKHGNHGAVATALAPYLAAVYLHFIEPMLTTAAPERAACVVVPVPLHTARLRERGYNQSLVLAEALVELVPLPLVADALMRVKPTSSQKHLTTAERHANVKDAFVVRPEKVSQIRGCNVLLLDDVYTTGATTQEAARTLRAQGVRSVTILTLAATGF